MICRAAGPGGYICTLPEGHIEQETCSVHMAFAVNYNNSACDCSACVGEFIMDHEPLMEWEDHQTMRRGQPKITNPPDLRTAKARRLP